MFERMPMPTIRGRVGSAPRRWHQAADQRSGHKIYLYLLRDMVIDTRDRSGAANG
jgi:hypothetical protein